MTPLNEVCWDSDIELALLSLTRDAVKDRDYWFSTVSHVEDGIDPETNQQITASGLKAWVTRCRTEPPTTKEAPVDADRKTRRVSPSGRCVPHP